MLHYWVDTHEIPTATKVLEAGCATGVLCRYLSSSGLLTTGIDAATPMIQQAKNFGSDISYYVADITNLPFENHTFETVLSASLINIVSTPQQAINEMARSCKKNGSIGILVPRLGFTNQDLKILTSTLQANSFSKAALHIWHKRAPKMSPEALRTLLLNAGLQVEEPIYYLNKMVFSIRAKKP